MIEMNRSLRDQVARLSEDESRSYDKAEGSNNEALAAHLLSEDCSVNWKRPNLLSCNEKIKLEDHLHGFIIGMEDLTPCDDIWCRMFRRTLKDEAIGWYQSLKDGLPSGPRPPEKKERTKCNTPKHQARSKWDTMRVHE